jgi:hypothetical protein
MTTPIYVLAASVSPGNRIKQFHRDGPGTVGALIADPPSFRYAGFDLSTLDTPHSGPGESIEVGSRERKLLRLYQDGTLIARLAADESFLGWGQNPEEFRAQPRLNPVPVVESHASFVHLYRQIIELLHDVPNVVEFKMSLRNAVWNKTRLFMTSYYPIPFSQVFQPDKYLAHAGSIDEQMSASIRDVLETPNGVAYRLVVRFAAMFDMPEQQIPFTIREGDLAEIDIRALQSL